MAGGKRTSHGGKILEQVIRALSLRRFAIRPYDPDGKTKTPLLPEDEDKERILIKNYPYKTIFGTAGRREWFLESPEWTGQLECKFQNVGGSTDEKMLYIVETLRRSPIANLVLVYGGDYWINYDRGKAIIEWLKRESGALKHSFGKTLLVMNMDEFFTWVARTFP